jgi:hypothetical protein
MNWRFIDKHFYVFRDFLEKNHFTIKEKLYSPKVFGNAYAVLVSSNIEIKLVKDRDRISVEMRGWLEENSKWYGFGSILKLVGFTDHTKYVDHLEYSDYLLHLNQLTIGLEKKYVEIQNCLNSPEFLERLNLYIEKEDKRLMEELLNRIKNKKME